WNWTWTAENDEGELIGQDLADDQPAMIDVQLEFDNEGTLEEGGGPIDIGQFDWGNGSDPAQEIEVTLNTTQFDSESTVISQD
ncbi:MAG: flagellar basal body FlgE domain-containing protein, partial [Desulfopila sp.]